MRQYVSHLDCRATLPQALALLSPAQMRAANQALTASEAQLRSVNTSLEARVEERTAELAAKEARLLDLLATLDLGTFMTHDLDGTIRFWSDGCAHLYGWTAAEAVGQNAHELLHTMFLVSLTEVGAALERDGGWTSDLRHRARDGREVVVTARRVLRRDADGSPVAVLVSLTDVTEARRVERERRRADALLRTIIGTAPGMIYAKDQQGRVLLANNSNSKWLLTVVGSAVLHGVIHVLDGASGHPCCWRALGVRGLP